MRREWSDESQQTKDKVDRLAAEVATQSDAGRMRMIVQRFAREVIPDSKAIVGSIYFPMRFTNLLRTMRPRLIGFAR